MSGRTSPDADGDVFFDAQSELSVNPNDAQRYVQELQSQPGDPPIVYLPPEPMPPPRAPRRVHFALPDPSPSASSRASNRSASPPPAPLSRIRSDRPDRAYFAAASVIERVRQFVIPAVALDIASGVGAAIMANRSTPVAWWSIFVGTSTVINTTLAWRAGPLEQNPILLDYLRRTELNDRGLAQRNDATERYFRRQTGTGLADAAFATTSLVGGHDFGGQGRGAGAHTVLGPLFNSALHVRAVVETSNSFWQICDSALVPADGDVLNRWITWYKAVKATRLVFRATHSLLPAFPNNAILAWLAAATGVRLLAAATVGDFFQAMAQVVHFKAYQECNALPRSNRAVYLRAGGGISIPPNRDPGIGPRNRPYTRFIYDIFTADPFPYSDGLVDAIIRDPTGWNAIAHRLVVL